MFKFEAGYLQFILAAAVSFVTAIVTTVRSRHREKANQFSAFMEESTSFRKELVEDRLHIKEELSKAIVKCDECRVQVRALEGEKKLLMEKITNLKIDLDDSSFRIDQLTEKLRKLKEVQLLVKDMNE